MSGQESNQDPELPMSSHFAGPVAELMALRMLQPPNGPGLLAALDDYEILRLLGTGGMGLVLLARKEGDKRHVAIKMIRSEYVGNQDVVRRFLKEAGHLQKLRHSNIVPVEEVCSRALGPYFVMPFFERGSLAGLTRPGEPMDFNLIQKVALGVAAGLAFAHRSGIIHRDIKPANVLIRADGQACLADFGLARTLFNDSILNVETRSHEGTAPYMSPAVAAGDAEDTRCDIYSFGAVLYEMLTGFPPYRGRGSREILDQILAGPPRPVTDINPGANPNMARVVEGCMARELRDRYASMKDVIEDLERVGDSRPLAAFKFRHRVKAMGPTGIWSMLVPGTVLILGMLLLIHFGVHRPLIRGQIKNQAEAMTPPPPRLGGEVPPVVWSVSVYAGQPGVSGAVDGPALKCSFHMPNGLAIFTNGALFVADTANNTLRRIDPNGRVSTLAGLARTHGSRDGFQTAARFWGPFGVADDTNGNIYVADTGNNTLRKVDAEGHVTTFAGVAGKPGAKDGVASAAGFRNPWGLALGPRGNLFVADGSNHAIRRINSLGEVHTLAGQPGISGSLDGFGDNAEFNNPSAVAVDVIGNVYVADSGNHTIRKISPSRVVTTLAGRAGHAGYADGVGDAARFWNPQGIAVDAAGTIYVADTGNNVIRKITPTGRVSTIAGAAGLAGMADGVAAQARFDAPSGMAVDAQGNLYVADANNQVIRKITPVH